MFDDVYYPPPAFHFRVDFLMFPSPSGYGFKEVSGIEAKMETMTITEGGENMFEHRVPGRTTYDNLVLKRGMHASMTSPLVMWIMTTLNSGFLLPIPIVPQEIFITLMGDDGQPTAAWSFHNAYPVRWVINEFDSENTDSVALEEIEFAYSYFTRIPAMAMKLLIGAVGFAGEIVEKVAESEAVQAVAGLVEETVEAAEEIVEASVEAAGDIILEGIEEGLEEMDEALEDEIDAVNELSENIDEGSDQVVEDIQTGAEEVTENIEGDDESPSEEESSSDDSSDEALGPDNTGIGSGGGGDDSEEDEDEDDKDSNNGK